MFQRRKHNVKFSPIVNKENTNFLNFYSNGLENNDRKKKFILRLDSSQKKLSQEKKPQNDQNTVEKQYDSIKLFDFKTLSKPIKPWDLPPTQCPHASKKESKSSKRSPNSSIAPRFLDFSDDTTSQREENSSEWKVQVIEVIPPCQGFTYDLQDSDEEVEMWHKKFEQYDMEEDKENMPLSDEESEVDSDLEESESFLTKDSESHIVLEKEKKMIPCSSFDSLLKKNLQEIHEVDEASNTNVFEINK